MVQVAESGDEFSVQQFVGEGGFARVFAADWVTGPPHNRDVVLKIQMPANTWEWYILSRYSTLQYSTVQYSTSEHTLQPPHAPGRPPPPAAGRGPWLEVRLHVRAALLLLQRRQHPGVLLPGNTRP